MSKTTEELSYYHRQYLLALEAGLDTSAFTEEEKMFKDESDTPAVEIDEPVVLTEIQVEAEADLLGRKFEAGDLTESLIATAEDWIARYIVSSDTFAFLRDMKAAYTQFGHLTEGQARGVLNCMVADVRQHRREAKKVTATPSVAPESTPEAQIADGTYTVVRGDEHRTFRIKTATKGALIGKTIVELLVGSDNETDFNGVAFLTGSKATLWKRFRDGDLGQWLEVLVQGDAADMQEAYALRSSRCARCNRTLTVPASIHRGLGPECASRA